MIYHITRTRLVTERFRVEADDEEGATITLSDEMELPLRTANCECVEVSTVHSEIEIQTQDEYERRLAAEEAQA